MLVVPDSASTLELSKLYISKALKRLEEEREKEQEKEAGKED